jgi:hypothetical protein
METRKREFVTSSPEASMNLRLILWTVGMAYATFLLARGNGASSFGAVFTAPFLGAAIGVALASLFAKRAKRKQMPTQPSG